MFVGIRGAIHNHSSDEIHCGSAGLRGIWTYGCAENNLLVQFPETWKAVVATIKFETDSQSIGGVSKRYDQLAFGKPRTD